MKVIDFLRFSFPVLLCATVVSAEPVAFDPDDFGKIVIAPKQATSGFVLEQAIGAYQNEPVLSYGDASPARKLGRPVGRLDVLYKNRQTGFCTAFIVDARHIVTNNHCIPGPEGVGVLSAQLVMGYVNELHPETAERFNVGTEPVETDKDLDYSVLDVFGDPSGSYGLVELTAEAPEDSDFFWIIGHPNGLPQHISREGCAAAEPAVSLEGKLVHTCDTLGGNSGSPVFRVSDRRVVGLHHAGNSQAGFNYAIPMARIVANSRILKASMTPDPVVQSDAVTSCDQLWVAAQEYGCPGYQAFVETCGEHPLLPLAETLQKRDCRAEDVKTEPVPGPDPSNITAGAERLPDWQAELIENARQSEERCDSHLLISEGYMRSLKTLNKEARNLIIQYGKKREAVKHAAAALKLTYEDLDLLMPEMYMLMDSCTGELEHFLDSQDESEMRAIYAEMQSYEDKMRRNREILDRRLGMTRSRLTKARDAR